MKTSETIKEIATALCAAQSEFRAVPKSGKNTAQNYSFADTDDYLTMARGVLPKHGLSLSSSLVSVIDQPSKKTNSGGDLVAIRCQCLTRLLHISGEWIEAVSWGEGQDSGDKATYKATTGARKYGIALVLGLATGDDPDAERPRREREPRQTFTPTEAPPSADAPTPEPPSEAQIKRIEGWAADDRLSEKTRAYLTEQLARGLTAGAAGALIGKIKTKFAKELREPGEEG